MSINHQRPRQDRRNVGRAPVKRHVAPSVGADSFHNPVRKTTAQESAALDIARAKNRAGRQPL